jgi:hypothetical protein
MVTQPFDPDDDFPFGSSSEGPRPGRPPEPPRPPEAPEPPEPPSAARGDDPDGDEDDDAGWERVREAAWRVGQRARRHERVLHTRISQELAQDLRRAADDLRVPVSNLVRNVLEEAFGAVERVSDEVGGFLEEVLSDSDEARGDLRRLRRGLHRLASRGRRRARRRFGDSAGGDEDADDAFAEADDTEAAPGDAPAAASPSAVEARSDSGAEGAPPGVDRLEATLRETGVFRPRGAELAFPEVLGWQPLLLNAAAACACGERQLAAGEEAYVAVTERGLSRTFLCRTCMRARGGA